MTPIDLDYQELLRRIRPVETTNLIMGTVLGSIKVSTYSLQTLMNAMPLSFTDDDIVVVRQTLRDLGYISEHHAQSIKWSGKDEDVIGPGYAWPRHLWNHGDK